MAISHINATHWAHAVMALTLTLGFALVGWEAYQGRPVQSHQPQSGTTTTRTTEKKTTATGTEVVDRVEITTVAGQSLSGQILGQTGLWLARILLVMLCAFLAGAAVQRALLGNFAFKAGLFEVPALPPPDTEEIEQLKSESVEVFTATALASTVEETKHQRDRDINITGSSAGTFFDALQEQGKSDYALVDLGGGDRWLTTRLFLIATLFQRMRSVRAFVFVETMHHVSNRYIGLKTAEDVRWRLAYEFPWLEQAFARAYGAEPNLAIVSESGALDGSAAFSVTQRFLSDPAIVTGSPNVAVPNHEWVQVSPGRWEHARWISRPLIERVINPLSSVVIDTDALTPTQTTAAILASAGPFVALVDKERRFKKLFDRHALLERAAHW